MKFKIFQKVLMSEESVDVYIYIFIIVIIYLFFCTIHFICNKIENRVFQHYPEGREGRIEQISVYNEELPMYSKYILKNEKQIIPPLPTYVQSREHVSVKMVE